MFQADQQVFSNANSLPSTRFPTQLLSEQLEAEWGGGVCSKNKSHFLLLFSAGLQSPTAAPPSPQMGD